MNCSEIVDNDVLFEEVFHRPQPAKLLAEDINRHTDDENGRCTSDILVGTCNRAKELSQKLQTAACNGKNAFNGARSLRTVKDDN